MTKTKSKKVTKAQVLKLIDKMDFKGLSEAYRESEIAWSAKEWKEFVETIEARQKKEIIKKLEELKDWMQKTFTNDDSPELKELLNDALDQAIKTINENQK